MDSAYSTAKAALIGEETLAESQRLRMHADKLRAQITAGEETLAENQRLRMRTAELAAQVRTTLFTYRRHRFPHLSGASDPADGTPLRELASAEAGRAAAEAAARVAPLAEQRLRVTLASIGDAVIATDVDGRVTLINRVAAELTGWSSADAVGKQLEDVFVIRNELTNQLVENPVAKVLRQGAVVGLANHTVLIAKDGRRIPIGDSAAPIQTADGQLLGVVLVFRDMTAQRDHERTLFRLAAIAESSEDAILTKTFDGLITSWNPGAELMFGYSTNEAVGQPITMLFPPDRIAEEAEFLRRLGAGERVKHYETERVRKDGQRIQVSVSLSPLYDEAGAIAGVSKIVRDITEQKRREAMLRIARTAAESADQAKDDFLAVLSHDLRTPLTTMAGWIKMLQGPRLDPEQRMRAIETIDRSTQALAHMIDDLLDISRIAAGRMALELAPINLVPVIAETVDSFQPEAAAKGIALRTNLGVVRADEHRMRQSLSNLLVNALRHTPGGGRIDVDLVSDNGAVRIRIQDTGCGIPPDLLPHVFGGFGGRPRRRVARGAALALAWPS